MSLSRRTTKSLPEKAFLVVCVFGLEDSEKYLGFSNDIEIEDYLEELEALAWNRLDFYTVENANLVWSVGKPRKCPHTKEVLIDESPSGCEFQCLACARVRYLPHGHSL